MSIACFATACMTLCVYADGISGTTLRSTTHSPLVPYTLSSGSTTPPLSRLSRQHRARRRRVVHGRQVLLQPQRDVRVRVGADVGPGVDFATEEGRERLRLRELARELDLLDERQAVCMRLPSALTSDLRFRLRGPVEKRDVPTSSSK